ncbi:hypothetical protein R1sor_026524 [Riccia sorocarpa]|uniref:Uncharacterized protein n=1 Tax=Riccia sorocarpa TaxID=122646 RepID=A0ABD3GDA7_9MARC
MFRVAMAPTPLRCNARGKEEMVEPKVGIKQEEMDDREAHPLLGGTPEALKFLWKKIKLRRSTWKKLGKLENEITSHTVLTTGRDNINNIFDIRSLEKRGTYWFPDFQAATNWRSSCLSLDENYLTTAGLEDDVVIF